jgi:pimeloyl-ACP methyl ester carboxylesterase
MAEPATGPQPGTKVEDLGALVDFLELPPLHLVGVAGGGFIGYDYALWHPERVRSLLVAASGGAGALEDAELAALREKTALPGFRKFPPEFREVSPGYMAENPEGLKRWLEIHNNARQEGAPVQPHRIKFGFEELASLRVPTQLMAGDQDLTTPPWVMRRHAARIPGAEFVVFPEGAHALNYEYPEAFNRELLKFISRH